MKMSLQKKILLLTIGLVVSTVMLISIAVLVSTNTTVKQQAQQQLIVGERVFDQLLEEHGNQLFDSASVLVDDFGFKQAVTSKDIPTIESALENAGSRINADLIVLVDRDGHLVSHVSRLTQVSHESLARSLMTFDELREGSEITQIENRIYQIVLVPVRAPLPVAWIMIGLEMDDEFASQLKSITNLEVGFGKGTSEEVGTLFVSTLSGAYQDKDKKGNDVSVVMVDDSGEQYLSSIKVLKQQGSEYVLATLNYSLDKAYAKFDQLLVQILSIVGLALGLAILGALITSRNVTSPIADLVVATKRISEGDYEKRIKSGAKASTEILELGRYFESMQSQIREREKQLSNQAFVDALTGLGSRLAIHQAIENLINTAPTTFTVLRLNLNRFKEINDTFGYEVGDTVLKFVGDSLQKFVGDTLLCARFGGDEFAFILVDVDQASIPGQVNLLLDQMEHRIDQQKVAVSSVRLGIACYPEHGVDAESLLRRAEIALYKAKDRDCLFALYEIGEEESHRREIQLVSDLKEAIRENKLELYFQAKYSTKQHRVIEVEALLRWIHDDFGFVSPEEFIDLAEQSGQMNGLTEWVIDRAATQRKIWLDSGLDINIAINLSASDLNERLPGILHRVLEQRGLNEQHLILEVTESAFIDNPKKAIAILNQLKKMGFTSSIDDYGTGYSSLSQLKQLPVNELKIDKSFILNLDKDKDDQKIVRSTIELAKSMSLTVVAEGVETLDTCLVLARWGCDKLQGYFISRPVPASQFETWLLESHQNISEQIKEGL